MLRSVLVACALTCIASTVAQSQTPEIRYVLSVPQPQTHLFHVELEIQGVDEPEVDFSMPVWSGKR